MENIYVERVRANVKRQALYCDMLGSARWVGELAQRYPAREITPLTPWFANISIHDVEITGCSTLVDVSALPEKPVKNFFSAMSKHIVIGLAKYAMPQNSQ